MPTLQPLALVLQRQKRERSIERICMGTQKRIFHAWHRGKGLSTCVFSSELGWEGDFILPTSKFVELCKDPIKWWNSPRGLQCIVSEYVTKCLREVRDCYVSKVEDSGDVLSLGHSICNRMLVWLLIERFFRSGTKPRDIIIYYVLVYATVKALSKATYDFCRSAKFRTSLDSYLPQL